MQSPCWWSGGCNIFEGGVLRKCNFKRQSIVPPFLAVELNLKWFGRFVILDEGSNVSRLQRATASIRARGVILSKLHFAANNKCLIRRRWTLLACNLEIKSSCFIAETVPDADRVQFTRNADKRHRKNIQELNTCLPTHDPTSLQSIHLNPMYQQLYLTHFCLECPISNLCLV